MPSNTASKRFLQTYDALPPDAQQLLVQKHLAPLLNVVSKAKRDKAIASATVLQQRYARMPPLDPKAKKAEIAALLHELSRDSKRALIMERSFREQLLSEVVDTLAKWLNDIWKVVFEFRSNFTAAHACLLFVCDALEQIANSSGGCRCAYATLFVPVKITKSTGTLVKSFILSGAHNLEKVALWVWRDLLITVLATGTKRQRSAVPDMIDDIRLLLGWRALERLLRGGPKSLWDEEEEEFSPHESEHRVPHHDIVDDDDNDEDYVSDDWSTPCDKCCPGPFYAPHWSWRIADQQPQLRNLVYAALFDIFKVAPSGPLCSSMIAISEDEDELEKVLHPVLMSIAVHSSDNFSAALRILSLDNRTDSVDMLLNTHKYLLRPQDAASLQFSVLAMSSNFFYRSRAISIVEEELLDVVMVFRASIRLSFCNIDSVINKTELAQILTLRQDSLNRRTHVARWVKDILTPHADSTHPMALATLMIGIPLPPGVEGNDEGDMLGYFEVDGDDPDVEDLREEFRPNIKARLQGWVDTAIAVKGGSALLLKVYSDVIVDMPFLRGGDVVEEMSSRMADRPCKMHVSDALDAFRDFCEKQDRNLRTAKRKAARNASASTSHAGTSESSSAPQVALSTSESIEDIG